MSADQAPNPWDCATLPPGGASRTDRPHRRPALRVRAVDGTAFVDIVNAETLYAEEDISHLANQLCRLAEDGHTRLVLNFRGVHTMSSDVLGMLAALHRRLEKSRRRLAISGLDPVLRDMLRICRLDRVFDVPADEAEPSDSAAPREHRDCDCTSTSLDRVSCCLTLFASERLSPSSLNASQRLKRRSSGWIFRQDHPNRFNAYGRLVR